jgi:hypothetical protein
MFKGLSRGWPKWISPSMLSELRRVWQRSGGSQLWQLICEAMESKIPYWCSLLQAKERQPSNFYTRKTISNSLQSPKTDSHIPSQATKPSFLSELLSEMMYQRHILFPVTDTGSPQYQ